MQTATEQKYPVAIFELIPINKIGSGFEREDTLNLPEDQKVRIIHPKRRVIINESVVRTESTKNPGTFVNVPTRYIYNQEVIIKENQEKENMSTSLINDKIVFINGLITVPKDGAYVGLYEFLTTHAQNISNPDRLDSLQPIFREIKPAADAHDKNVNDLLQAQAMGIILKLVKQKGDAYEYQEEQINSLCSIFGTYAETPQQQVSALMAIAKAKPQDFLNAAKEGEQVVAIEIKHAIKLKLIGIVGNIIAYNEGENPKIKEFSNAQNTDEKKFTALGNYFQKVEGKEAYELFKARLEAAKVAATV